jgi:hypothetical protein
MHATVVPRTITVWNRTVWNRIFRTAETFPHPHEDEKSSKPFVFCNYPAAETIARAEMRRLKKTEKLSCETAAAFFGGKFIDLVLEKEYKEEWEVMEEEDKAFARQDFLLENHLKEKSNPQTASNFGWLTLALSMDLSSDRITPMEMSDRSSSSTGCSMERNSLRMRSGSTNGCS